MGFFYYQLRRGMHQVILNEQILTTEVHEEFVILVLLIRLNIALVLSLAYLDTQRGVIDELL